MAPSASSDILLHANVLRNYGQNTVADGAQITLRVQQTPRGAQASEVLSIEAPPATGIPLSDESELVSAESMAALPVQPARVKWFDKAKGFGFGNVFGSSEDVFLHIEVLRVAGFADLAAGEAIGLRVIQGRRGLMAAQIVSWDSAGRK